MPKLDVDIVTAERLVYSEREVDELIVPGVAGELGVLPLHAPLLTMIQPGVLRVVKGGEEVAMAITGGFIEGRDNRVTILAAAARRGRPARRPARGDLRAHSNAGHTRLALDPRLKAGASDSTPHAPALPTGRQASRLGAVCTFTPHTPVHT